MSGVDDVWFSASDSTASNSPINAGKNSNKSQLKYRGGQKGFSKHTPKQQTPLPASCEASDESEDDFEKWLQQQQMKKNKHNIAKTKHNNNLPSSKSQEFIEGYSLEQPLSSQSALTSVHGGMPQKIRKTSVGKAAKESFPEARPPVLMNGSAGHTKQGLVQKKWVVLLLSVPIFMVSVLWYL